MHVLRGVRSPAFAGFRCASGWDLFLVSYDYYTSSWCNMLCFDPIYYNNGREQRSSKHIRKMRVAPCARERAPAIKICAAHSIRSIRAFCRTIKCLRCCVATGQNTFHAPSGPNRAACRYALFGSGLTWLGPGATCVVLRIPYRLYYYTIVSYKHVLLFKHLCGACLFR